MNGVDDTTCDEILRGGLRLHQPKRGYRFNIDSLLLADFVLPRARQRPWRLVDLCAGCGVIGLALLSQLGRATLVLAELQSEFVALAIRNVADNGFADRATVVEVDLSDARLARRVLPGGAADLVVSSPPYFRPASGPTVAASSEAMARHELRLALADVAREAKRLLVTGGRAGLVFPSERLPELLHTLDGAGLRPSRLQVVYGRPGGRANRVLVEAVKGGKGALAVEPPLFVRDEAGAYGEIARRAIGE